MATMAVRPASGPRGRRLIVNWRTLLVAAVALVIALSLLSSNWQRQLNRAARQGGQHRAGIRHGGVGTGGERDQTLAATQEAQVQLQQLAASIEQSEGAAAVLKQGRDGEGGAGGEDKGDEAAAAVAPSPPPPPPPLQPGACLQEQPWISHALDVFFEHAWRAANASLQTSAQALEEINKITWVDGYRPGHDEVTLRFDAGTGRVVMEVREVAKPNQYYKKDCILETLRGAVEAHNEELALLLKGRELKFVVVTEDFGLVWRGSNWKLPTFALCTDDSHSDIPVPDFTYACYPETRYKNSSWPAIRDLLVRKSSMLNWQDRYNDIFHRSHWGVGPRQKLMPLFLSYQNSSRDEAAFGARLDIGDTGFNPHYQKRSNYVWLDSQCDHRYQIHTAGFSYSAGLKYKLACGSVVFKFESKYVEFYEPALQDGVHVIKLQEDSEKFEGETVPRMRDAVKASQEGTDLPAIAHAGQEFALRNLTVEALHCYWYGALQRYSEIYFLEQTPAQAATAAAHADVAAEAKRQEEAKRAKEEAEKKKQAAAAVKQQQQKKKEQLGSAQGGGEGGGAAKPAAEGKAQQQHRKGWR